MSEPNQVRGQPTIRNSGELRSSMEPLAPFFRIGGLSGPRRNGWNQTGQGLFRLPGESGHSLVLPVRWCLASKIKETILGATDWLNQNLGLVGQDAQPVIKGLPMGVFTDGGQSDQPGRIRLDYTENVFALFRHGFHYLTSATDVPGESIVPRSCAPFVWQDPWQLMRWAQEASGGEFYSVSALAIDLVWNFDRDEPERVLSQETRGLDTPKLNLRDHFEVAPGALMSFFQCAFKMNGAGWALATLSLGEEQTKI